MGSSPNKDEETQPASSQNDKKLEKIVKKSVICLVSFLVSLAGGLVLGWWRSEYEPESRELWMVPFGLVLLVTPVIVWFSVFFSDASPNQCVPSPDDRSTDPER